MKIKSLVLATNDLVKVTDFYGDVLGFPILKQSEMAVTFQIGTSKLTFEKTSTDVAPTYHYAFNISENLFKEAKEWLKARVDLVTDYEGNEIVDFPNWNAHAIYFMDSVGNIGELIARHDLDHTSSPSFSSKDILSISEVGLPVVDVLDFKEKVSEVFDLPIYKTASAKFSPLGDEEGLFICVPLERIWFPTKALKSALFPIQVTIYASKTGRLIYGDYEIESI